MPSSTIWTKLWLMKLDCYLKVFLVGPSIILYLNPILSPAQKWLVSAPPALSRPPGPLCSQSAPRLTPHSPWPGAIKVGPRSGPDTQASPSSGQSRGGDMSTCVLWIKHLQYILNINNAKSVHSIKVCSIVLFIISLTLHKLHWSPVPSLFWTHQ